MLVDYHCHSNCSDGELSPQELIKLAEQREIKELSITDHDTIDAYANLPTTKIKIISGIEFSTVWNKIAVHIVGLNFNLKSTALLEIIKLQQHARKQRAQTISNRLEKIGLENFNETLKGEKYIGRPDFAKLLVEQGICSDEKEAFQKYLGAGKIGDVKNQWLSFENIISVILEAGGSPVLAHPLYYKLTNAKLNRLIIDFKKFGGGAIEVINGFQNKDKTQYLARLCNEFDLKASVGSDFHNHLPWKKLGIDSDFVDNLLRF